MFNPSTALLLAALMVLANAFFVASEFAIVKIRPTRVKELVAGGGRRARVLSG
jgi:CBS domain containing-hemolysin-like protein